MTELPPLGLYVHWPYCARICPYCDFNVALDRRAGESAALGEAILADLRAQARMIGPRRLVSIFFGGGTPSLADPAWVARLIEEATGLWPAARDLEITLEANPTDAEAGRFAAFAQAGVNRLSLGVQALDDASLTFLGRNHGAAEARRAAELAGKTFERLSLDLIYALPGQSADDWIATLDEALALGPEHISPYQLTIELGTAFDRAVRRKSFAPAEPDLAAELYDVTQTVLSGAGFDAYEVSNHARGMAARSRHNLVYWRGEDYLGVGPGAHGRITGAAGRAATQTFLKIDDYLAVVQATGHGLEGRDTLTPGEAAEERLLMGLRIDEGVLRADLAPLTLHALPDMTQAGLIRVDDERLYATLAGRLVLDRVIAELAGA
ncbi:MAG TPA: radical SAM family heme chaperone HemW [Caulobacteraceae bacterium]|nr:radical SAM family heme chaperone HemW [Caulobacteraceae bacterium]